MMKIILELQYLYQSPIKCTQAKVAKKCFCSLQYHATKVQETPETVNSKRM